MRLFGSVGFFLLLVFGVPLVWSQSTTESSQSSVSQLYVQQTNLPPYVGPQSPPNNLVPEVKFPMDNWVQFHGDEATNSRLTSLHFRYSNTRTHNVVPSTCSVPITMSPLPGGGSAPSYDELFSFDLNIVFDPLSPKATNVRFDLNADSTLTNPIDHRGVVVALIDSANNFYVGFERSPNSGNTKPLGRILYGTTSADRRNLLNPTFVEITQPLCRCNNASDSLCFATAATYCPTTEQSWNTYFSIEPNGAAHVAVSAFSQFYDRNTAVPIAAPGGLRGPLKLGVFSTYPDATHDLHGMWIQVRNEQYQIRTRIFSAIWTGTQLKLWVDNYLSRGENPISVPRTRAPYYVPYPSNRLSADLTCYPNRWEFGHTTTAINQGSPPKWNNGVRSSDEQEFEQQFYFPVVKSGIYNDNQDLLITLHTVADKLNPETSNRFSSGITDTSISGSNAGRYFGFTRGTAIADKRLGWLVNGIQIRGANGFLSYSPDLGDNVFQQPDDLGRVNLYLTRGGEDTPTYIQVPYDDESLSTIQSAYQSAGTTVPSWSYRMIQSRKDVPPGHIYVFVEGWTESHNSGKFLTQAFFSGGSTSTDTSSRRLDGSQPLAIATFQFIGKTRASQPESEEVILPGQYTGVSMMAFSMDILSLSCMRREGEPEQWDLCEVCNGNNSCVDCKGVPYGTSKPDVCGVCNGNGTSCLDCLGVANGTAKHDYCGVCAGNNSTCLDCAGVPKGPNVVDACGVCAGDNSSCADCQGVPNGSSKLDSCEVCDGDDTSCIDCLGIPHGTAVLDACGVCDGDNTSCCINYLGVYNYIWDWLLLRVAIDDLIVKLENLYYMLECINANLPWYDNTQCDGESNENAEQIASLEVGNMAATHTEWLLDCLQSFNEMVVQWTDQIQQASL